MTNPPFRGNPNLEDRSCATSIGIDFTRSSFSVAAFDNIPTNADVGQAFSQHANPFTNATRHIHLLIQFSSIKPFRLYPLLKTSFDIASAAGAYAALLEADDSIAITGGLLCEY